MQDRGSTQEGAQPPGPSIAPSGAASDAGARGGPLAPSRDPDASGAGRPSPVAGFEPEAHEALYGALLLPRLIEEKMLLLLRQGRLSKWFSGIGQEAIAVGVASALEPGDWILPMHRNLGVFTTRGLDLAQLFRQLFGKEGGFTKGRDRTFHFGVLEKRIVGMISHLGSMLPVADGLALAAQLRGERRVAAAFTGEGATSEGDFHEAVNLAAVWRLPVLFVIENNEYGLSTPVSEQYACGDLADRGPGYGIPGVVVDGNDILAVHNAVSSAAGRARAGQGPTLLEFKTFRMRGHEEASGTAYVPKSLFEEWGKKDPVARLEALLLDRGILTTEKAASIRGAIKERIDGLVEDALAAPDPASTAARELADVYEAGSDGAAESGSEAQEVAEAPGAGPPAAETPALLPGRRASRASPALGAASPEGIDAASDPLGRIDDAGAAPERRYVDAVKEGLAAALRSDPRVLLMGQDIAEYGGVFKVTEGFLEEFGRERIRNTPIIESAALGAALGLALDGFVPIVEMQFGDFITCGFNQIVNNLAKTRYRWGAPVPVVVRCPVGGGVGAGPFHSQNIEAWFAHVPGLKIVAPATPYDAKGLLLASVADGNPVLYLEHKFLYRSERGRVPSGPYTVPIGRAKVSRAGRDATVVTYGAALRWALEAASRLAGEGKEIEVVDLRSLLPWDRATVVASVKKTSRAMVLHEAPETGGFGGEVASVIGREAFEWLDAPVVRLGALDTPVPFARGLEEIFSPKGRLLTALEELLAY